MVSFNAARVRRWFLKVLYFVVSKLKENILKLLWGELLTSCISWFYFSFKRNFKKCNRRCHFWRVLQISYRWTIGCLESPPKLYRSHNYFVKHNCNCFFHQVCQITHTHQLPNSKPCCGRLIGRSRFRSWLASAYSQRRKSEVFLV